MKVLVIGGGGREHALTDALSRSPSVAKLYCAPGNAGIAQVAECIRYAADDTDGLLRFATEHAIDLTVVGPEQPLVAGIVDRFRSAGLRIFGPSRSAARLEGSKAFSKDFMRRHGIPTASSKTFGVKDLPDAERYIRSQPVPVVVKADGLAAGKGVIVCETHDQAVSEINGMISGGSFGDAGKTVIVEEYLQGDEASIFVITDGRSYAMLPAAQDHKRVFDEDKGKNTGGMGAYAPAPVMTPALTKAVEESIVKPTLAGMRSDGEPYTGCLFVGIMLTPTGPKVLEYNCRFGDPETQAVVSLLDCDLAKVFGDIADRRFDPSIVHIRNASAVCVVMASGGYPDAFEKGKAITGIEDADRLDGVKVFHAGTTSGPDGVRTSGGRVLGVTAFGPRDDIGATIRRAYDAVRKISFEKAHFRSDIGRRALTARSDGSRLS